MNRRIKIVVTGIIIGGILNPITFSSTVDAEYALEDFFDPWDPTLVINSEEILPSVVSAGNITFNVELPEDKNWGPFTVDIYRGSPGAAELVASKTLEGPAGDAVFSLSEGDYFVAVMEWSAAPPPDFDVPLSTWDKWFDDFRYVIKNGQEKPRVNLAPQTAYAGSLSAFLYVHPFTVGTSLPSCCSSIAFIPGIKATTLYHHNDQVWPPSVLSNDLSELALDENGESINDITVGDAIGSVLFSTFYQPIFDEFDELYADGVVADWKTLPYDWRYTPFDVVENPVLQRNGQYSMTQRIEELAENSQTGKVTIVAHSNGGLVAKALLMQLEELGEATLVDKIILIATPQLGTPKAVAATLHGTEEDILGGLVVAQKNARELARNLPNVYNLFPSEHLFERAGWPLVYFNPSSTLSTPFITTYEDSINTWQEEGGFLKGNEGRNQPDKDELWSPAIVNSTLYDTAMSDREQLDAWRAPEGVQVYALAETGYPTIKGWRYEEEEAMRFTPLPERYTRLHPIFFVTKAGDETVLQKSADYYGDITYFDGGTYFLDTNNSTEHAYIFNAKPVQDYILSQITDSPYSSPYLSSDPVVDPSPYYTLSVHSPVNLLVKDGEGNRVGIDEAGQIYDESTSASFFQAAGNQYLVIDNMDDVSISYSGYDDGIAKFVLQSYENDELTTTSHTAVEIHEGETGSVSVRDSMVTVVEAAEAEIVAPPEHAGGELLRAQLVGEVQGEEISSPSIPIDVILSLLLNPAISAEIKWKIVQLLL